jgi:transposase
VSQNFSGCNREQAFLLLPSLDEWLPQDHFARLVIAAVEAMDLSAFYAGYRADGHDRPAHDPVMMVALLVYAYARGERSSRVIERGCLEDMAMRFIAANRAADGARCPTSARAASREPSPLEIGCCFPMAMWKPAARQRHTRRSAAAVVSSSAHHVLVPGRKQTVVR